MDLMKALALAVSAVALTAVISSISTASEAPVAYLRGTDFQGGAAELYGSMHGGQWGVNYVYAQPTGSRSTMAAKFHLSKLPEQQLFLHLKGRDDDGQDACDVAIEINSRVIFEGPNDFSQSQWQVHKFALPKDALKEGDNTITVSCREKTGGLGNPPWFQVSRCAVAGEKYVMTKDISRNFRIDMPDKIRDFPEPLPAGKEPGFKVRGIKAWMWKPEQYLSEIPILAKYKMNFFMNCYTNMCDLEHYGWGNPEANRWYEDLPESKKKTYEQIVKECRKHNIQFCFSMNPNLGSKRILDYYSQSDIDQVWKHYKWMQGLGVKWFNISLDDISQGIDPSGQSKAVNEIYRRLKKADPEAMMIFTPTIYWGDGSDPNERKYLETIARELDKDIYLYWTGNSVVGNITRKAAESYRAVSGHRLFLWDNYPVNDAQPTMHLGPVINRDLDLCEVIDGYLSNSLCPQNEGNRIPVLTAADYAYNPYAYDPMRSVGQAIMHLEDTPEQRQMLKEMIELYPGFVIYGKQATGLNPVREQFAELLKLPHGAYITNAVTSYLEDFAVRMDKVFPTRYQAEKQTIRNDIQFLKNLTSGE